MQTLIKFLPQFNSFQHIFFRSVIGWILSVAYLLSQNISLKGKNSKMLIYRGLVGSVSMFSFFYILTNIPYGSAVAFKYLSPIFSAIFAVMLLNEKVNKKLWFCFVITFVGILLLKGFDARISLFDLTIGLISGITGGLLYIIIRKIGEDDHHLVILHYFMFIAAFFSGLVILFDWKTPNLIETFWLILIGIIGFVAQNLFTLSIQDSQENISSLSILRYTEVIYALIIGYFWFGEIYNLQSIFGLLLIFAGLLISIKYRKK